MTEKVWDVISGILGALVFAVFPIGVMEVILSARWNKKYFTLGVSIFVLRVPVKNHHSNIPSPALLESNFKSSGVIRNTSLLFQEIDLNTMGFRETLLQFGRNYSIMHGLLIFDTKNSQVMVKGFLDWTILYFSLLWILGGPLVGLLSLITSSRPMPDESISFFALGCSMMLVILGVFCSIDYFRFSRVAKFAAEAWSRKHTATMGWV
jgi:hypothetical protein